MKGNVNRVRMQLASGINPSVPDPCGDTPLHYAAYYARLEVVRELIAAGADRYIRNNNELTPKDCIMMVHEDGNIVNEDDFHQIVTLLDEEEIPIKEPGME